jgi:3'-phosphoadenosine 5'-phosphosulfate sulfotransferase (PAPS reductase)/FAD synthetase
MHEHFVAAMNRIEELVSRDHYERKKSQAVARVKHFAGTRPAFAWSGGKDSIALQVVCESAGVYECCLGMSNLEYPAFLQWITDHMPHELAVYSNGWDLEWLVRNQRMMFPKSSKVAAEWFKGTQHAAQKRFFKVFKASTLFLGRRLADGNFCGKDFAYESQGVYRVSPIADWTHEDVLACLHYEHRAADLPPFYRWPRGYRCGTHSWPARQWCDSDYHAWSEIHEIDAAIVQDAAAAGLDTAKLFLDSL